jgi:hypothetical protein
VKDHTLYYFQKKEATRDAPYYGSVPLRGGTQLSTSEDSGTSFSLIAPDRVFYLRAPSPEEYRGWVAVLRSETLGTINRIDEEDAPEKQRAKREFSRNTVLIAPSKTDNSNNNNNNNNNSNNNSKNTLSGSAPDSSVDNFPSIRGTGSGSAPVGFGDMLSHAGGVSPSEQAALVPRPKPAVTQGASPGALSERRFFEKVGLAHPASESEESDFSESEESEKVGLLKKRTDGAAGRSNFRATVKHKQQQEEQQQQPHQQGEEEQSDCCCTVL